MLAKDMSIQEESLEKKYLKLALYHWFPNVINSHIFCIANVCSPTITVELAVRVQLKHTRICPFSHGENSSVISTARPDGNVSP